MFNLSTAELLVIFVVAILVLKPQDLPPLIQQIVKIKRFFTRLTTDFDKIIDNIADDQISNDANSANKLSPNRYIDDLNEINNYLDKIIKLGSTYAGEYDLAKIRNFYDLLTKQQIAKKIKSKTSNKVHRDNDIKLINNEQLEDKKLINPK